MYETHLIDEDLFMFGEGHLIWFDLPYSSHMSSIPLNTGYRVDCVVRDSIRVYYKGVALLKRRHKKNRDHIVLFIPSENLGAVSLGSSVVVNVETLVKND